MEFAALRDLWDPPVTREELLNYVESEPDRADYLYELGRTLSHLHLQNILPDPSESNFVLGKDGVKLVDYGGIRMAPRTDADYAENILPFMMGFSRLEWQVFKRGYLSESYVHCAQVIEYIESGDAKPWIRSIAEGNYADAASQLRMHLDAATELKVEERVTLTSDLALSLTMSGDHTRAVDEYRHAITLGTTAGLDEALLAAIFFNLAWAAFRSHDFLTAEESFLRAVRTVCEKDEFQPRVCLQAMACLCEIARMSGDQEKQRLYARRLRQAKKYTKARGESPDLILSGLIVHE